MKKIAGFLVRFRLIFLSLWVLLAVIGGFFIFRVNINYDLTAYLPEDSKIAEGIKRMEAAFGDETVSHIKIMVEGLSLDAQATLYSELVALSSVDSVLYDETETYHEGDYTLFVIEVADDAHSDTSEKVYEAVQDMLKDEIVYYGGDIPDAQSNYLITLIAWAAVLLFIVLFLLGRSWFEPLIYLVTLGVAVLLNYGTNGILPNISDITFTISAVLQLVLSIDYAIMLSERYRQERLRGLEPKKAMETAIQKGMKSITASSLTTILGLLCLIMMNFTIGIDISVVLAKGIVFSYVSTFLMLPALLIQFDAIIKKSEKKPLNGHRETVSKGWQRMSAFQHRFRYAITALFAVLVITGVYFNQKVAIDFFLPSNAKDAVLVEEQFPTHETVIFLYDNSDEEKIYEVVQAIETVEGTESVVSYASTLAVVQSPDQWATTLQVDPMITRALMHRYYGESIPPLSLNAFSDFIITSLSVHPLFSANFDATTLAQLEQLKQMTTVEVITAMYDAEALAVMLPMDATTIDSLITLYYTELGEAPQEGVVLNGFVDYLVGLTVNPTYSALFTPEQAGLLQQLSYLMHSAIDQTIYTPEELSAILIGNNPNWTTATIEWVYLIQASQQVDSSSWGLSTEVFLTYLATEILTDPMFESFFEDADKQELTASYQVMIDVKSKLVADTVGRIIITTPCTLEDDATIPYLTTIDEIFQSRNLEVYAIGSLAMAYEMNQTFLSEYNLITLISIAVIFLVIMLSFASPLIPILLVTLIQTSIYLTMSLNLVFDSSLYFLAIILVQAILIGAAIDYAILFTNYYRDARVTEGIKDALKTTYQGASRAILTSSVVLVVIATLLGLIVKNATIASILITLAIGFSISIVLTLLILPALLVVFDKLVCWQWKKI